MLTLNKGEWSELYTFLQLLGNGVLIKADQYLNPLPSLPFAVKAIIINQGEQNIQYCKQGNFIEIKDQNFFVLKKVPCSEFLKYATLLYQEIIQSKSTFAVPLVESFIQSIGYQKVKASSNSKADLTLIVLDLQTNTEQILSFSLKSYLGKPATLLNASKATNFLYQIPQPLHYSQIEQINQVESSSKIKDRLKLIYQMGGSVNFIQVDHLIFNANLQMVDSCLPLILATYLLQYYTGQAKDLITLTNQVHLLNPCNFNLSFSQNFYEYKVKNLLTAIALGLNPSTPWNGQYQANGGYIVVKQDGKIVSLLLSNLQELQNYLYANTRLETPSSSRHDFGSVFLFNQNIYLKLNLQIRFT